MTRLQIKVEAACAALRDWQRGRTDWDEAARRADLSSEAAARLARELRPETDEAQLRRLLADATRP